MITLSIISLGIFLMMASKSTNPVKTSMAILGTSVFIFIQMGVMTGTSWIPILMVLLFMGGIIMMFMILSSVLPNEKSMKVKSHIILAPALMLALMSPSWMGSMGASPSSYKSFLSSGNNFWVMMALILTYFVCSLSMLSAEETPMRTLYCY